MRTLALVASSVLVLGCGDDGGGSGDDDPSADAAIDGEPPGCPAPTGEPWQAAPAVGGGPIQETAAVAVDGKVYVIGGFNGQAGVVDTVRVYDTATCAWSDGPELPEAVHHANVAAVDGTIYVLGFLTGLNFAARGDVWAWTPSTDAGWSTRAAMPAGTQRGSSIVGVIDGVVYLAGGLRGGAVADVSAYDPALDAWDDAPPDLPEPRDHGCGGVVAGTLYVTGGREGAIESTSPAVYAYAPGGAWASREGMPTGRGGTACGVVGDRIIVAGGEGNPDDDSGVYPQVEAYDPALDEWMTLPPMPTPRHGMAAAAWGDALYVPGGATVQAFGAVDTHEVLTPE